MTDIVKRLNRGEGCLEEGGKTCISMDAESGCICAIAADTILALRAENEKLRAALKPFANLTIKGDEPDVWAWEFPRFFKLITTARAALEEKQ